MPRYEVEMTVVFAGVVEADSEQEAEDATYDDLMYCYTDEHTVTELEEEDEEEE